MKSVAGPLVAAIVLAVAGFGFWLLGKTETRIADMHKELAMLHYDEADSEGEADSPPYVVSASRASEEMRA